MIETIAVAILLGVLALYSIGALLFCVLGGGLLLWVLFLFALEITRDILR